MLDNLEEVLISSDVGVETTIRIIQRIEERVQRDKYMGIEELNRVLKEEIAALLKENNANDQTTLNCLITGCLCDYGGWCEWSRKNDYDRKVSE